MTIRERIDRATPSNNKWNSWPDLMEIITCYPVDLADSYAAYNIGYLIGSSEAARQIRYDSLPTEMKTKMFENKVKQYSTHTVHFTLATDRGQIDDKEKRNIIAVLKPNSQWSQAHKSYIFSPQTFTIAAEIGCNHDYEIKSPRNCLTIGTCKKCGHHWECDSSD